MRFPLSLLLVVLLAAGCSTPVAPPVDSSPADTGPTDTPSPDTGGLDGGFDTGPDAGLDASRPETASPDTGAGPDARPTDVGTDTPVVDTTPAGPEVTFVVTVPAGTPRFDAVQVAGNVAELGAWSGHGLVLARASDGRYTGTQRFAVGTALEFKITRGTWETVEKNADGSEVANHAVRVDASMRVEVTVVAWRDRPMVTGNVQSLGTFHSAFLADRPVLVYLPPSYDTEATRRFPVLYLHDGQNCFDHRTAFGGIEWGADETAERLITAGQVQPVIMVAVGNTSARIDEYTPTRDAMYGGGLADRYARLLVEELKPLIDGRFRTLTAADSTGVAGSSLGGLVSMYLGITRPTVFHRLGVISPSVWWDDLYIVGQVHALTGLLPLRIWEDIGTNEGSGSGAETVADARLLRDALVGRGWRLGVDLGYREYPGAMHNEAAWAARFGDVLQFMYPP